ncbi:MAG: tripartite tricarboxylate transporter TctB family protein [Deltaproteobacteria bacterium]|nr:tripartite tricarboxylate transporter TctB family protein [Deltaproteobacteria bacterium]
MKTSFSLRFFFSLAVAIAAGYALYASLHWPFRTALFPRVIGVPLLVLSAVEMLLCLAAPGRERKGHAVDFEMTTDVEPLVARKRTLAIFSWTLGFLLLILLSGFTLAVPLFVFLYLKVAGKEGWRLTLLLTVVSWIFMEGLFTWLLHLPFPEGWIFSLWR